MLVEGILNAVFSVLNFFLLALPDISWSVDDGVIGTFLDFIETILYLFPMKTVITIIGIVISINVFKIVISTIKTIWSFIPFV